MKMLVKMKRNGALCYSSHLDLLRQVQRTLRRASLPIQYSQGFNPHPILSFAQALGVGLETIGDYFMIELAQEISPDELVRRFNEKAPCGLSARKARPMDNKEKSPMARVKAAQYRMDVYGSKINALHKGVGELMGLTNYICEVRGKKKDIRTLIHDAECDENGAVFLVSCGNQNLPHKSLIQAVVELSGLRVEDIAIRREDLFASDEAGRHVPLFDSIS